MKTNLHPSTRTLILLDLGVAILAGEATASAQTMGFITEAVAVLVAVLIPIVLLRWKSQSDFRSLPLGQRIFAVTSLFGLIAVWLHALLLSAGLLMGLGTPETQFRMLN